MRQLAGFLERVQGRMQEAVGSAGLAADQQVLLRKALDQHRALGKLNPLDDPVAVLYLVVRAWGRRLDEQVERVAAFCSLFLLAADLLDDVQDGDLAGKSHAASGAAVATNDAVALLFLALRELHESLAREGSAARQVAFLRLVDRVSLLAVSGQHRDLTREPGACSRADVLEMHVAKTASVSLVVECGALLSGCDEVALGAYGEVGAHLTRLVQVRDDLRDAFGKSSSPDLRDRKPTFPMACFLECAGEAERARMAALLDELPGSLEGVRALLYDSGAVAASALAMEESRRAVHERLAATGNFHAAHRVLLDVTDAVAHSVYAPPALECSEAFWVPPGAWHVRVRDAAQVLAGRLAFLALPPLPALRPWHRAQWMYVPERRAILYPDVDELAEEVLPFQAELLGDDDLSRVAAILHAQVHVVLAHEVFHFWRHAAGRLTRDHWHEEWAANRLAVAYLQRFDAVELEQSLRLAESILARFPGALDERAEAVLRRCVSPSPSETGYGMNLLQTAVVGVEMVRRLAAEPLVLEDVVAALLSPPSEAHRAA